MEDQGCHLFNEGIIRGVQQGRVRQLKGFQKNIHREPDAHNAATESFIRKVGSAEVERQATELFQDLRHAFGYTRRELEYQCEGGSALLRTPHFTVSLLIEQDPETARLWNLTTDVSRFEDSSQLLEAPFLSVFQNRCCSFLLELPQPIDVAAQIDHIESNTELAAFLEYPPDASWLSLTLPPNSLQMRMTAHTLTWTIPDGERLDYLISGTLKLLEERVVVPASISRG